MLFVGIAGASVRDPKQPSAWIRWLFKVSSDTVVGLYLVERISLLRHGGQWRLIVKSGNIEKEIPALVRKESIALLVAFGCHYLFQISLVFLAMHLAGDHMLPFGTVGLCN